MTSYKDALLNTNTSANKYEELDYSNHDEEIYQIYLNNNSFDYSKYIKKTYDVDIKPYFKQFQNECLCRKTGCNKHPVYHMVGTCNFNNCEEVLNPGNPCCNSDGMGCACEYFCWEHKETIEAKILLAKIDRKPLVNLKNMTLKRYWLLSKEYRPRFAYDSKTDVIVGTFSINEASDNLSDFEKKLGKELIYDSESRDFVK